MQLHTLTSRFRNESGQAVIEFALVMPLLIALIFLLVGLSGMFNAYNDLNEMAADGARFAAVGNLPDPTVLLANADTTMSRSATFTKTYQDPVSLAWGGPCVVGGTVKVTATAPVNLIQFLPYLNANIPGLPNLTGSAEMRVEQC